MHVITLIAAKFQQTFRRKHRFLD